MKKFTKLAIGLIITVSIVIGLNLSQKQPDAKPAWVHQVRWEDKPDDRARMEEKLWTKISPYKTEYELVYINLSTEGRVLRLKVIAAAKDSDNPDIYDFVYESGTLFLKGYLLEAVPAMYRNEAISIALRNKEVAASVVNSSAPVVRRILPSTSERFYAPKTLFSVTWVRISALIDLDERKVIKIWRAGAYE